MLKTETKTQEKKTWGPFQSCGEKKTECDNRLIDENSFVGLLLKK